MKTMKILALVVLLSAGSILAETDRAPSLAALTPKAAERDARLGWWRAARFGMFVHWGVYSRLGGSWQGQAYGGYAEHIQRAHKIPLPVEGDAGKEKIRAQKGAGGMYDVKFGTQSFAKAVRDGVRVTDQLGKVPLAPGNYAIRVTAGEITGEELFRLRSVTLTPIP